MHTFSAVLVSVMALSAMAAPTETITSADVVATSTSVPSTTINPGSTVQFQLYNSNLCIGTPASSEGANMFLTTCDAPRTIFELPSGAPTESTQLALEASEGPILCVNARDVAVNNAVFLDVCEDDVYERWRIIGGSGLGPIVSTGATNGTFCLSAPSNTQGSPVTFGSCTGGFSQQWSTTVLSTNAD